jgi:DNA-binding winged helix-turn-helix (wHTH) protein
MMGFCIEESVVTVYINSLRCKFCRNEDDLELIQTA